MGNRKIDKIIVHHSKSGSKTTIDQIDARQRYKGRDGIIHIKNWLKIQCVVVSLCIKQLCTNELKNHLDS